MKNPNFAGSLEMERPQYDTLPHRHASVCQSVKC